jgi:23S rRNA pseudouridine1911/1915/1917 synthase
MKPGVEFHVPDGVTERVDKILAKAFPETSRSLIKKSIINGNVTHTDGSRLEPKTKLFPGHSLLVNFIHPEVAELEPFDTVLDVIYEDEYLILINKPSGMVVHPGDGTNNETLVHALLNHCPDSLCPVGAPKRPGIVHRLDKDTSGVMVIAKKESSYHKLVQQFADRSVEKKYTAIAVGRMKTMRGIFTDPIGRHPKIRVKMAVVHSGKKACTEWKLMHDTNDNISIVDCNLKTGRTHQIRVHFSNSGHPLVGDKTYGYNANKYPFIDPSIRVMLHARQLSFKHPVTEKNMTFTTDLPADMLNFIKSFS